MKMTDLRAKARAIFGDAIAEPMPKQPNGAYALQQRANARPIPTYKVGGPVKKADGGMMPKPPRARVGSPEADDVLITTPRGRQIEAELRRREAEKEKAMAAKRARADRLLGIPAQKNGGKAGCYADGGKIMDERIAARMAAGNYKKGGKVQTSSDTARKLAKEMGGMKKGGKAKDGLAVMIAIGKPVKEKATGERYASKKAMAKHEAAESAGMERMERMKAMKKMNGGSANVRDMNMEAGKVTQKMAAGGAGKRGAKPVKKAVGGKASDRGPTTQSQADAAYFRMQGARALVEPKGGTAAALSRMPNDKPAVIVGRNDTPVARGTAKAMYEEVKRNPPKATTVMPTPAEPTGPSSPTGPSIPTGPTRYAAGGAGKTRKGQAPIKKAQGGAAKVRKGMMSPSGKMLQPIKPKSGIGETY